MFLVLWEFEVKPGCEQRFEKSYRPDGDWARFFRRDTHYRETRLLRDPFRERIYLTLDAWDSQDSYEIFREQNRDAYLALDQNFESLTLYEKHLGSFEQTRNP